MASSKVDALAAARRKFGRLVDSFAFYGAYHSNKINQLIHIICVPLIFTTALVFLSYIPLNSYVPEALLKLVSPFIGAGTELAPVLMALAYVGYYLYLTPNWLGALVSALVLIELWVSVEFSALFGAAAWQPALLLHVIGWVAQFVGHGKFEGRAPALLDSFFQALFTAQMFTTIEVILALGGLQDFHKAVKPLVDRQLVDFKRSKKAAEEQRR